MGEYGGNETGTERSVCAAMLLYKEWCRLIFYNISACINGQFSYSSNYSLGLNCIALIALFELKLNK